MFKILVGTAAAVIIAGGLYLGWGEWRRSQESARAEELADIQRCYDAADLIIRDNAGEDVEATFRSIAEARVSRCWQLSGDAEIDLDRLERGDLPSLLR